ncbi:GNAT family N-acetyltransferase [Ammoniphilus sp. YIM 78166]|uniref:GNAT family N-acetyltransferase n=1 Tax=Ammoniphilus sp. YIM 78166 TaxID=1644106 RepID=UPI00106F5A71|nr:GNAT family N-acetyltransferase [Ammoniphilus sp. YIM 78166]
MNKVKIEQIKVNDGYSDDLADLLMQVVEDGASIGFLPPMQKCNAASYWESVCSPEQILYIATFDQRIIGSIQLHLSTKQNGTHRAEIAKLMTHPNYRRMGIGRLLMQKAEKRAVEENRSLLILDTREGDPSNHLYTSLGFLQGGRIPNYARSATGELDATIIYYKILSD